jgi:hypothetical protein
MSRNKIHYDEQGDVFGFGEIDGDSKYLHVDDYEKALDAFNARKSLNVIDGVLVISESRSELLRLIRIRRDEVLNASDIDLMKLADEEILGADVTSRRHALAAYRQALRDITLQDPFAVTWPTGETNNE